MTVSAQQLRHAISHWGARVLRCHSHDCSGPRRAWEWISRGSGCICVEGLRYCFPQCFERELRLRFARLHLGRAVERRPSHRVPLGLIMLSRADVTGGQLRHALAEHGQHTGTRIGECLQRLGYVGEWQVTSALAQQWRCPVLQTVPQQVPHCGLPYQLLKRFQMLPVHFAFARRELHVAFASEIAYRALVAVEKMLDCKTEPCLTTLSALQAGIERMQQHSAAPEKYFAGGCDLDEMVRIASGYATRLDASNVKLVACDELTWIRLEAESDCMNLIFQRTK